MSLYASTQDFLFHELRDLIGQVGGALSDADEVSLLELAGSIAADPQTDCAAAMQDADELHNTRELLRAAGDEEGDAV